MNQDVWISAFGQGFDGDSPAVMELHGSAEVAVHVDGSFTP